MEAQVNQNKLQAQQQRQNAPPQEESKAPPAKKKPFIPPLLGAKNLGMSTLVQANGKT